MEDLQNTPSCVNNWFVSLANEGQFLRHLNENDFYHFSNEKHSEEGIYLGSADELQQEKQNEGTWDILKQLTDTFYLSIYTILTLF